MHTVQVAVPSLCTLYDYFDLLNEWEISNHYVASSAFIRTMLQAHELQSRLSHASALPGRSQH